MGQTCHIKCVVRIREDKGIRSMRTVDAEVALLTRFDRETETERRSDH